MAEERVQRRLAAILAADVVGYSRLMGADEEGTLARLKAIRGELLHPKVAAYGGRIVKITGDGTLIEFPSAVDAVSHAIDVQRSMARRNVDLDPDSRIVLRMGINVGDVIVDGDDIYGDGVNVAARLETTAEPGCICISGTVYDQVRGKLDAPFRDLGEQSLKNIAEPVRVIALVLEASSPNTATPSMETIFRRPALAVLPFENLSGNPEQEYFADGLTEDIITALSLWRSFPVIARNSTFAYKGTSPDIRRIGEDLGARYVVEGSVRRAGSRVRVTAQLINAETGHHVWAERYDRDLEDIFALQDELTQRIAATIAPEVERAEHMRSSASARPQLDAWTCVQRGFAHLFEFNKEGNARAREMFEKAIRIDPTYSRAHTGLAWSHHRDIWLGAAESLEEKLQAFSDAAHRAVQLDENDSLAQMELGIVFTYTGRHEEALAQYKRAIELNPSNALAYAGVGQALVALGKPIDGIRELERALQLNPKDPRNPIYYGFMAQAHLAAERHEVALEWAQRALRSYPDRPEPLLLKAAALGHLGRTSEAANALAACKAVSPDYVEQYPHKSKDEGIHEHFLDGLRKAGWEG